MVHDDDDVVEISPAKKIKLKEGEKASTVEDNDEVKVLEPEVEEMEESKPQKKVLDPYQVSYSRMK